MVATSKSDVGREIAWLIERDIHSQLHYWSGRNGNDWRTDHMEALRFARRDDAELMLTYHCNSIGRVVEHMWVGTITLPTVTFSKYEADKRDDARHGGEP